MEPNYIGYLIYCWDRKGYGFIPVKYDPATDYTNYLSYYTDEDKNKALIAEVTREV